MIATNNKLYKIGKSVNNNVHLIPNGIDLGEFKKARNIYLHDTFCIPHHKKIALSVGRHHPVKGFEFGIKAFNLLKNFKDCDDIVYVIVGGYCDSLMEMIDQGAAKPALVIGMPVGFIGASEAKAKMIEHHAELGFHKMLEEVKSFLEQCENKFLDGL